jgi:hypothetical protein
MHVTASQALALPHTGHKEEEGKRSWKHTHTHYPLRQALTHLARLF